MRLRRDGGPLIRVGHRGAAALSPENTLASLRTAIDHGVDAVEFDVLDDGGALVLAHSLHELPDERATLDEALALIAETQVAAHVDLKARGLEAEVANALRRHGLVERSLVSSLDWAALRDLRRFEPGLHVGLSYPEDRFGLSGRRVLTPLLAGGLAALRMTLPRVIGRWLERAGAAAAVVHHELVTRALVERCAARDVGVWAWTVNDPVDVRRLEAAGADAIITDDPRILG